MEISLSYLVLARKWRPQNFEDVVGQEHITQTLKNAITGSRIAHAFLFSGPRGVGKTTTARILAKALNCEQGPTPQPCNQCSLCREITNGSSLDIIEIDGASNNSVDDIRDLRERVRYTPTRAKYKVYIIDEVHMLSTSAFNALLKTLEEPPAHVIFVLATTEPQKIPATIASRCQHFAFRRIPSARIAANLKEITQQEGVNITPSALAQIARAADGSLRDAQSILEQVISYGDEVNQETIQALLGTIDHQLIEQAGEAVLQKDPTRVLLVLDQVVSAGYNLEAFHQQLLHYFRNLLLAKICESKTLLADLPQEEAGQIQQRAEEASEEELSLIIKLLLEAGEALKRAPQQRIVLELYLTRLTQLKSLVPLVQILERLTSLEQKLRAQGFKPSENEAKNKQVSLNFNHQSPPSAQTQSAATTTKTAKPTPLGANPAAAPQTLPPAQGNNHDCWQKVVQLVAQEKTPLAAVLNHGALLEVSRETVKVAFDSPLWCSKLEENHNKEILIKALEQCLNHPVKLEVGQKSLPAGRSLADYKENKAQEDRVELEKQALADPLVGKAMDIFRANILEVKTIP